MSRQASKAVNDRINELASANGGRITPDDVIADARANPEGPIAKAMDFDPERCILRDLRRQARDIIQSCRIVIVEEHIQLPCFAYVETPDKDERREQGYTAITSLRNDADAARAAVIREFQRAAHYLERARKAAVALGMAEEIEELSVTVAKVERVIMEAPESRQ